MMAGNGKRIKLFILDIGDNYFLFLRSIYDLRCQHIHKCKLLIQQQQ